VSKFSGSTRRVHANTKSKLAAAAAAACIAAGFAAKSYAAPYASAITVTGGTNVSFVLNQTADQLTYSINNGPAIAMPDGTAKGSHSFTLTNPSDTFTISAVKQNDVGYSVLTGNTIANNGNNLSQPTVEGGFNLISSDSNPLVQFLRPQGVGVNTSFGTGINGAQNFGTAYIGNTLAGATPNRTLTGDGLYALKADQTDAFGQGNAARLTSVFPADNTASPYRVQVGSNGEVYVCGFADDIAGVWRASADLTTSTQLLNGVTGPNATPLGQNHGSVDGFAVSGSSATGDLKLWTID
jgi:hypothetical protein